MFGKVHEIELVQVSSCYHLHNENLCTGIHQLLFFKDRKKKMQLFMLVQSPPSGKLYHGRK